MVHTWTKLYGNPKCFTISSLTRIGPFYVNANIRFSQSQHNVFLFHVPLVDNNHEVGGVLWCQLLVLDAVEHIFE